MSTRAGTVPLSDLQFLKIYFNRKRLRSTPANLRKMLAETGGDAICNGSIFLRDLSPACHLKADGKVHKAPNYRAWAVSWSTPADFGVKAVPNGDANYMECVHLIIGGKKISPVTCGSDMRYRAPRTAIGTKNGRYAYYVSRERHTPEQLRDLLACSGWDNAIMMDGGGSTCFMDSAGEGIAGDGRVIPFFLVWKLKREKTSEPKGERPMVEINAYSKAKDGSKKRRASAHECRRSLLRHFTRHCRRCGSSLCCAIAPWSLFLWGGQTSISTPFIRRISLLEG